MKKLVSEGGLKPGQLPGLYDFIEDRSIKKDVFKLKATNNELGRDEIRALIFLKKLTGCPMCKYNNFIKKFKKGETANIGVMTEKISLRL